MNRVESGSDAWHWEQKYNLIISITCTFAGLFVFGSLSLFSTEWLSEMLWIIMYTLLTTPHYYCNLWKLRCSLVASITAIERPQSHLTTDYPLVVQIQSAYELQLNQIIRHHEEWIISPGYLNTHSTMPSWHRHCHCHRRSGQPARCTASYAFECVIDGQHMK